MNLYRLQDIRIILVLLCGATVILSGVNKAQTAEQDRIVQGYRDEQSLRDKKAQIDAEKAQERAHLVVERVKAGCTVVVLEQDNRVMPQLSEGQGVLDNFRQPVLSGFVCTNTSTAEVIDGKAVNVIHVAPEYVEEYLQEFNILVANLENSFQQRPNIYPN